jgi:hypothetical protein
MCEREERPARKADREHGPDTSVHWVMMLVGAATIPGLSWHYSLALSWALGERWQTVQVNPYFEEFSLR